MNWSWHLTRNAPEKPAFFLVSLLTGLLVTIPIARAADTGLLHLGEQYLAHGELQRAAAALEQADKTLPHDPRLYGDLGRVYYHLGYFDRAERAIRQSLALQPVEEWVSCWNNIYLGKIAVQKGEQPQAGTAFKAAVAAQCTARSRQEAEQYLAFLKVLDQGRSRLTRSAAGQDFSIHYAPGSAAAVDISMLTRLFGEYHQDISARLDLQKNRLPFIDIYLYPPRYKRDLWLAREALARHRANEMHIYYNGLADMGHVKHEMVHLLTEDYVPHNDLQPWLIEGLAEYVAGAPWGKPLHSWVQAFVRLGRFVPLDRLLNPGRFRELNPVISYSEAGSLVRFIIESKGLRQYFALANQKISLPELFGAPLARIERQWLQRVDTETVESADLELYKYRVWLGAYWQHDIAEAPPLPWMGMALTIRDGAAIINDIAPASPAEQAGLRPGDRLIRLGDTEIEGDHLWKGIRLVQQGRIGDLIPVAVERNGASEKYIVRLGKSASGQGS